VEEGVPQNGGANGGGANIWCGGVDGPPVESARPARWILWLTCAAAERSWKQEEDLGGGGEAGGGFRVTQTAPVDGDDSSCRVSGIALRTEDGKTPGILRCMGESSLWEEKS
jgi:hypothetical protein